MFSRQEFTELHVGSGDPLRLIDSRFEPRDPFFDAEEPVGGWPRRRKRSRKQLGAAAAILATLACGSDRRPAVAADSILVQLEEGAAPPPRAEDPSGPPIVALTSLAPEGEPALLSVPLEAGADPETAAHAMAWQHGVAFAEPVYIYRTDARTPNDPRFKDLWGLSQIDAPGAWARTTGDRGVIVAIVDDGIDLEHSDLKPNLWVNPQEVEGNGVDDDDDGIIDDVHGADFVDGDGDPSAVNEGDAPWHGSHVAGTIGAAGDNHAGVVGVNWKVSLMGVRALGPQGGRSDDLAKAINYAADHGARIINASWGGGGTSKVLSNAIARAGKKGVLFVAAAGNDSASSPGFPANLKLDNLLSVGATMPDDTLADFSDRGALIAAPGVGILSTTSPGQYERYDGTSMASPHVAGVAALLWAAHKDATLTQVRKAILDSGVPVIGAVHGRIDALRALSALDQATGGAAGGLHLSRGQLTFAVRTGRVPRAQTISLSVEGGGTRAWKAKADQKWIVLKTAEGETPARVSVRVDPGKLGSDSSQGHVLFKDESGASVSLLVTVEAKGASIAAAGHGCEVRDGTLHVRAGSGCSLSAADAEAPAMRWILPGGGQAAGSKLYAHFLRKGEFQLLVSADEGEVDSVPVVIE